MIVFASMRAQNIKPEYLYIRHINAQDGFLIKDNLPNALITFDSIILTYPGNSRYAGDFLEELGNSYYKLKRYDQALFIYLTEGTLFPGKKSCIHQINRCYEALAMNQDIQTKINSILLMHNDITAPLLLMKYYNSKRLDEIFLRYISLLRKKDVNLPKEVLLWEKLVRFNIRPGKRLHFLNTAFEKLPLNEKRLYFRKGNKYYVHTGNKEKAIEYALSYKKAGKTVWHKIYAFWLSARSHCTFH